MDAVVVAEGPNAADDLRSLRQWLTDTEELRGRAQSKESPPPVGTLGPVLDALLVALAPGAAVTALATTLVAWLRNRRSDVRIKVTLKDGRSLELDAKRVSNLDSEALRRQMDEIVGVLSQQAGDDRAV
ncbi:effector-associated constant component EACC1 [Micromonospora carbonacea]|uniref:effector-associated constant component EACC1 n=1 Tax=Micromonospora carbonacea TaxID=47853 RepID=UPI003711ADE1